MCNSKETCKINIKKDFFNVGPPKEDIFLDHLLWSIFHSVLHITYYKFPAGPLRAVFMYYINPIVH